MKASGAVAWILVAVLAAPCSARKMRQPLAVQQDRPLVVNFADLKPTLASIWIPSITSSQQKLQVPISGLPGTPLQTDDMSRLTYTVTYKRRPAYLLQGSISVQANPTFAGTGYGAPAMQIDQPLITLNQAGRTEQLPGGKVRCSGFMVADNSAVNCQFSARIFSENLPPAGTAQAVIQIPGRGTLVQTPPMQYDFTSVLPPNARFASTSDSQSTQFLLDTMGKAPPAAVVTNYFEQGDSLVLPAGVAGTQPAANTILQDSQTFTYTALFKELPRELCGKTLQVTSTATIQSTSDGAQAPETATCTVDIELLGCDASFQSNPPANGGRDCNTPAAAGTPIPSAPIPAAAAVDAPAAEFVPAAASTQVDPAAAPVAAAAGEMQQLTESPPEIPIQQQQVTRVKVLPEKAKRSSSSSSKMTAGQAAANRTVQPEQLVTVRRILADGVMPQGVFMAAAGSVLCGRNICSPGERCIDDMCTAPGSTLCAGSMVCAPGTVCMEGAMCCPVGSSYCAGQCCGSGNTCNQGRCLPYGHVPCGGNVCNQDQTCQGNLCCNRGETACGSGCCNTAAGMQCMMGRCMPFGTQPCGTTTCPIGTVCGDPMRSLCCAAGTRACNGNCCGRDQVCNWQLNQCVAINSEAARQSFQGYRGDREDEYHRGQLYAAMNGGGYPYGMRR
ncbi:hypothetical protein OEZ86_006922 [Tetradesmus obliquus]|nr:hypothetical protein OEZ86_006922 [Tetradesmus obliquus]